MFELQAVGLRRVGPDRALGGRSTRRNVDLARPDGGFEDVPEVGRGGRAARTAAAGALAAAGQDEGRRQEGSSGLPPGPTWLQPAFIRMHRRSLRPGGIQARAARVNSDQSDKREALARTFAGFQGPTNFCSRPYWFGTDVLSWASAPSSGSARRSARTEPRRVVQAQRLGSTADVTSASATSGCNDQANSGWPTSPVAGAGRAPSDVAFIIDVFSRCLVDRKAARSTTSQGIPEHLHAA